MLLVHWRFDPLSERTARLTQRMELLGENAAAYVDEIQSLFEPNMEPGIRRIAQRMEAGHTWRSDERPSSTCVCATRPSPSTAAPAVNAQSAAQTTLPTVESGAIKGAPFRIEIQGRIPPGGTSAHKTPKRFDATPLRSTGNHPKRSSQVTRWRPHHDSRHRALSRSVSSRTPGGSDDSRVDHRRSRANAANAS